jgi:azurin
LNIAGSHVLPDGSVFLEIPDLQPVNQLHLRLRVDSGDAKDLFATVHALDAPFTEFPGYKPAKKIIAAHPLLSDMALLAKAPPPNPWRRHLPNARPVAVEAGQNLSYATRSIVVKAGEPIKLTFINPDVVPHNWVLVQEGALQRVGEQVNRLVADPEAAHRQYVPKSDDVLAYVDVTPAGQQFIIYFQAPTKPGRYPYLCSFPGHWMVMNGQLIVQKP